MRELENTLHRAVLLATGHDIGVDAILTPDGESFARPARPGGPCAGDRGGLGRALVGRTVADVERGLIIDTLDHCLGNRTHAAKILGISIRTLRNKLNEYTAEGVAVPRPARPVTQGCSPRQTRSTCRSAGPNRGSGRRSGLRFATAPQRIATTSARVPRLPHHRLAYEQILTGLRCAVNPALTMHPAKYADCRGWLFATSHGHRSSS